MSSAVRTLAYGCGGGLGCAELDGDVETARICAVHFGTHTASTCRTFAIRVHFAAEAGVDATVGMGVVGQQQDANAACGHWSRPCSHPGAAGEQTAATAEPIDKAMARLATMMPLNASGRITPERSANRMPRNRSGNGCPSRLSRLPMRITQRGARRIPQASTSACVLEDRDAHSLSPYRMGIG